MFELIEDRCVIKMHQWDQQKYSRSQNWKLSRSSDIDTYLRFIGDVGGDDHMDFQVSCDSTCSGCTNGSAEEIALNALQDICVKFGWSDNNKNYPERNVKNCAYTRDVSTFNLSGDVGGDDSWFVEPYIDTSRNGGNSPMHAYLRSKLVLGVAHCDNNCDQRHYGYVGFDHSYCSAPKSGSHCQLSPVRRLKINMMGDVNNDDRIGLAWFVRF